MKHRDALSSAITLGKSLAEDFGGTLASVFKGVTEGGDHIGGKVSTPLLGIAGVGLTVGGVMTLNVPAVLAGLYLAGDTGGRYLEAGRAAAGPTVAPGG